MPPSDTNIAPSSIRVFLLIESRVLRESLVRLFRKHFDILVIGESDRAEATSRGELIATCDVLIIDPLQIPWLAAYKTIDKTDRAFFRTVVIGGKSDETQFLAAVRSGITGYLLQDASASDVVAAIRVVFRGEAVCPAQFCSTLFRFIAQMTNEMPVRGEGSKPDLTIRQQRLICLVAKGLTNKEIASNLNLSQFTVRNHIHRILKRVNAGSRREAVETIRAYGYPISA
jgi:DNA-binding NarL/FixJ family response regulator